MNKDIYILGLSFYYHDSAACILKNGEIVAAAQEERFTRKKHDDSFPTRAIAYCLEEAGITAPELDFVVFYEKPFLKLERLLETYLSFAPKGLLSFLKAISVWLKKKLWIKELIEKEIGFSGEVMFAEHHESHAAAAFYPSPFEEAAFLTLDGVGEWTTSSYGVGKGNNLDLLAEIKFPHSLGLLYSAFTYYTGFKVNSGEYKLMGLAPYGRPVYKDVILEKLIDLKADGSFRLNMDYFDYAAGLKMTSRKFHQLFGGDPRRPESTLTQKEMDLAASVQAVTEEIVIKIAEHIKTETGQKYLCMAGGVALNCVANGKLLRSNIFDDIWIQPAAGDAGGALGAALAVWYKHLQNLRKMPAKPDQMRGAYLGPSFSDEQIEVFLQKNSIKYEKLEKNQMLMKTARLIDGGSVIGWFQGRMEFGPRALGARSIIGDARDPEMQKRMNLKIKFRESFRPFAPSVLEERVSDFFDLDRPSPYMLLVADVEKGRQKAIPDDKSDLSGLEKRKIARSDIPAVTHVDYSARVQTVSQSTNPLYHDLIAEFEKLSGYGVVVNTSFNVRGEPIVCTPEDAYRCFMRTGMDYLVMGNLILDKSLQPEMKRDEDNWREEFTLD